MGISALENSKGVTLIELMITLVIVAIIVNAAGPAMRDFVQNQTVLSAITLLSSDVKYARSEAVDKKTTVEICPSVDGASCVDTKNWTAGWIVHITDNASCPAAGECVLRVRQAVSPLVSLMASVSEAIAFNETGASNASVTFALCRADNSASNEDIFLRTLELKTSGANYIRRGVIACNP